MTTGPQKRGRPKKRAPINDPKHPAGKPSPPDHLDEIALAEWNRVIPILDGLGKLSALDRSILAVYCNAWSQYERAQQGLTDGELYFETPNGYLSPHPNVGTANTAAKIIADCSTRLGLSPRDREKMNEPRPDDERNPAESPLDYGRKAQELRKKKSKRSN